MSVDVSALDQGEPPHSAHQLVNYLHLPGWSNPESYWWCKRKRAVRCRTGAQAHRIVSAALARLDDAINAAVLDRNRRKAEMAVATSLAS